MKNNNKNNRQSYIFTRETLGMTVLLFSALMLLILITYNTVFSSLGAAVCAFMYGTFGYGSFLVVAALCCLGVWLVFEKKPPVRLRTVASVGLTVYVFFMLFHAVTTRDFDMSGYGSYLSACYKAAEEGFAGYTFGGAVSGVIVYPVAKVTTYIGAYVIFSVLFLLSAYFSWLVVRGDVISLFGRSAKKEKREERREIVQDNALPPQANDNAYVVADNHEIVNNLQTAEAAPAQQYYNQQPYAPAPDYGAPPPAAEQPAPDYSSQNRQYFSAASTLFSRKSDTSDDKFSDKNLGRKILFEKGEFAAESYRRNMIFNDDSYFNHPVHNDGDYMSGFTGKKPSQPAQPQAQSRPAEPPYSQSYSQSYAEQAEKSEHGPATPSYIYGDKPADSLDDYVPRAESYESDDGDGEPYDAYDGRNNDDGGEDYSYLRRAESHDDGAQDFDGAASSANDGAQDFGDIRSSRFEDRSSGFDDVQSSRFSDRSADRRSDDDIDFTLSSRTGEVPSRDAQRMEDVTPSAQRDDLSDDFLSPDRRSASEEEGEDFSRFSRRGESSPSERSDGTPDLRDMFSSSRSASQPESDLSRGSAREEDSRENLFDGDDDEYLTEGDSSLGGRGLRSDGDLSSRSLRQDNADFSSRSLRNDGDDFSSRTASQSDDEGDDDFSLSDGASRVERAPAPQPKPAEPEKKPKHVWKKYVHPTLDLLRDYPENNNANYGEIEDNKKLIIETLENFHIAAHISEVIIGPAITRYDVIIEDRTNIKSAMRYREAIAMALMKENVTAYLNYSKGAISIEVPNSNRTIVGLKSMLTSNEFVNCKPNTLTFALGKNVEGKPNCPDITKMPHLLVAGTTGSGKSICLSSLIISLLYKYGPDELRFILVDPKQSEFISYENLPHLIVNEIISDVDKAIKALNWAIKEMERRYALFKEMTLAGTLVKNINEYNANLPKDEEKLPKIVIILDEFGDLMLQSKKDIESRIIRLVQKSRACGIHLILATQRPSVDCITGLIKSNLPTRIGFKVNSFDDSRTIFDIGGAEKLLGAGDLYYRSAQNPDLARIQGCFIDSPEVQAVTDFVKKNNESYFDQSVSDFINTVEEPESEGGDGGEGDGDVKIDDKFIQALKFCVTSNQASVSMLQRRFPIGYVKACKIIDWMENMNYITQSEGSKPRKVLLSLDEFVRIYGDVDD